MLKPNLIKELLESAETKCLINERLILKNTNSLNVQVKKILSMDPWITSHADVLMHDKPKNVCVGG